MHFEEDQFENKREDGKKLLRPFAKPTIFMKSAIEEKEELIGGTSSRPIEIEEQTIENTSRSMEIEEHLPENTTFEQDKYIKRDKYIKLKKTLKQTMRQCAILKKKLKQKNKNMEKLFNADQQIFLASGKQRGGSWSAETVNKALKLYVACGRKGYEEMRRQKLPYPSIRTLQYRIQGLQLKPGILEDILKLLKIKVSIFKILTK